MARLLALTLILFAACAALIMGARAFGQTHPTPSTQLEPGDCDQPCWHGLRPGVTSADQFTAEAANSPYPAYTSGRGSNHYFSFHIAQTITLYDLTTALGPPEYVSCLGLASPSYKIRERSWRSGTVADLFWAGGTVYARGIDFDAPQQITPDMQIMTLVYYAPEHPDAGLPRTFPWRGYASTARYPGCWTFNWRY